ncbi:MAG TPA: classical arabinogalactan protein 4, partial [Stenotrophomonas sp.]|nr:classical arabinogalactan protein 4 [Stenotrophomonas sp.]
MTPRLALLLTALLPLVAQAQVPTSSSPTATRSTNSVNPPPVAPQAPPQPANP